MTTIKLKNGSGAPTAGDLAQGEPALDLTNKRLYTEDSGGTVIEVGTNPGTDVTFADDRKAVFGAGSDLQIYHDGASNHSIIEESGTGNFLLRGDNLVLQKGNGGKNYLKATTDAQVELYYDNAIKLATTSSGIDVTGNVVSDGLTVDGAVNLNSAVTITSTSAALFFMESDTTDLNTRLRGNGGNFAIHTVDDSKGTVGLRFLINNSTGDISFYEDTGTTAKLFWDAADERLGIGNSSPSTALDVTGTVTADGLNVDAGSTSLVGTLKTTADNSSLVYSDSSQTLILKNTDASGTARLKFLGTASESGAITFGGGVGATSDTFAVYPRVMAGGKAFNITGGGDISFYEDTGTTAKFAWDAADETISIGLGASSTATISAFSRTVSANLPSALRIIENTGASTYWDIGANNGANPNLNFYVNANTTPKMTLASSGNVGIGTSSPSNLVHLQSSLDTLLKIESTDTVVRLDLTDSGGTSLIQNTSGKLVLQADNANASANSFLGFEVDGSEAMRIDSSGHVIAPYGVTLGTAVGTYAAANTLDDYEEGTFTPELRDATSGGNTATTTHKFGNYTKVGNLVTIWMHFRNIDTTGMTSGNAISITGLPFTADNNQYTSGAVSTDRVSFSGNYLTFSVTENAAYGPISIITSNAQDASLTVAGIDGTGSDIQGICVQYRTA